MFYCFPVKYFLKETKMREKKYLYTKYTALNIIRENATKTIYLQGKEL